MMGTVHLVAKEKKKKLEKTHNFSTYFSEKPNKSFSQIRKKERKKESFSQNDNFAFIAPNAEPRTRIILCITTLPIL